MLHPMTSSNKTIGPYNSSSSSSELRITDPLLSVVEESSATDDHPVSSLKRSSLNHGGVNSKSKNSSGHGGSAPQQPLPMYQRRSIEVPTRTGNGRRSSTDVLGASWHSPTATSRRRSALMEKDTTTTTKTTTTTNDHKKATNRRSSKYTIFCSICRHRCNCIDWKGVLF